jgi:hypothetical protein
MTLFNFFGGLGLGAGIAYWLDPDLGRRRRSLLRDRAFSLRQRADDAYRKTSRDLQNRAEGTLAELSGLLQGDDAPDHVVHDRVRAKLGRFVSHPHAIGVTANQGQVTLSGPILSTEVAPLIRAIYSLRGVQSVVNHLDVHEGADISALQGGKPRAGQRIDLMQESWAPGTRLLVGGAGAALMLNCLARRSPGAMLLGTAGFVMSVRALTNVDAQRMMAGSRATHRRRGVSARGSHLGERLDLQEAAGMPAGIHEIPNEPQNRG